MGTASSDNRRRHPRFVCLIPAKASRVGPGRIVNLSSGGCRFQANQTVPVGTHLTLRVRFPGRFFTIRFKAQVVHASADQLGLAFVNLPVRHQKILAAALEALSPGKLETSSSAA